MSNVFLRRVADTMYILMGVCTAFLIVFQIYIFSEYRQDVRDNRKVLCEIASLKTSEYCARIKAQDDEQ